MLDNFLVVSSVVFLCSLVQSVFGVGILLFGTPALLLFGYPFDSVLVYLLPCSITVNLMQILRSWNRVTLKRNIVLFCLPFVMLGLIIVLKFGSSMNIRMYVGIIMVATALLRISHRAVERIGMTCKKYLNLSLMIIGSVHGSTNMGGGLLSLLVGSLYREKENVRSNIAYGYLIMAMCQIATLALSGRCKIGVETIPLVAIAVVSYLSIGNRIYIASSSRVYQIALTGFIVIIGVTLLLS